MVTHQCSAEAPAWPGSSVQVIPNRAISVFGRRCSAFRGGGRRDFPGVSQLSPIWRGLLPSQQIGPRCDNIALMRPGNLAALAVLLGCCGFEACPPKCESLSDGTTFQRGY